MKLTNTDVCNHSIFAASTAGAANKKYLTAIAGATLEVADQEWKTEYASRAKDLIKAGVIKILVAPKETAEEKAKAHAAKVAAAKALLASEK